MQKQFFAKTILLYVGILTNAWATNQQVFTGDQEQKFIERYTLRYHLPKSYIEDVLAEAVYQPLSYETQLMIFNAPPHAKGKSFARYRKQFINPAVISRGKNFMCEHKDALAKAQAKYGVPMAIILGIIGVETSYGSFTGHFRVVDTLSTLAFNSPRRVDFWQDELAQYILMCYQYKLDPTALRGAIDGGFGLGQFMPSAYMNYAVSASSEQAPNLLNPDDAIMSVANYLKQHGWKANQAVVLNVVRTKQTCQMLTCNKKEPSYTIKVWQKNKVQIQNPPKGNPLADLITLQDTYNPKAWLALNNFYTIYSYNHSDKYAMVVYQLGNIVAAKALKSGC